MISKDLREQIKREARSGLPDFRVGNRKMTPEELDKIRVRAAVRTARSGEAVAWARENAPMLLGMVETGDEITREMAGDVTALLAEVERLRALVPRIYWPELIPPNQLEPADNHDPIEGTQGA